MIIRGAKIRRKFGDQIVRGFERSDAVVIKADRASKQSTGHWGRLEPGDCVLIAGKGHEDYQQDRRHAALV